MLLDTERESPLEQQEQMQLLWLTLMISLHDLCEIQKLCREQVKIKEKGMGTDGTENRE